MVMKKIVEETIENLEKNRFTVKYFMTSEEAKKSLLKEISFSETIGFGGSMTLMNMGMAEEFQKRGNTVYYHGGVKDQEEKQRLLKNAATADVYLLGTNAITKDGRLVNIDGTGNRLSSLLFGHKKVYIVVGVNKIVNNLEEAMIRIKNEACPPNAERLGLNTPCRVNSKCGNCDSPQRICNATLIMDRQMMGANITIYMINEKLGY